MARAKKVQTQPDLLTQAGAARVVGVPRQYIPAMVARGELDARPDVVEGLVLITKASAQAAADRRRQDQTAA